MTLTLQRDAESPMYLQIKEALHSEIVNGKFPTGTYLPSSRQLAKELSVSRITVTNALAELEADGFVQGDSRRGVFVLPLWEKTMPPADATVKLSPGWLKSLDRDPDLEKEWARLDLMRLSRGSPAIPFNALRHDLDSLPIKEFRNALNEVMREEGGVALDYSENEGYLPLRQTLAQYLQRLGVNTDADDIFITTGAQQAIALLAQTLVNPGDTVIVEEPTYPNAITAFRLRHAKLIGVPVDSDGMRIDELQRILKKVSPRLIYTVPTFHNPTGAVMSATRRRELVMLACDYNIPIVEDDYMREIRFSSPIPPPLAAFDRCGDVIHIGTFSKSLMPSLRLGYLVASEKLRKRLVILKRSNDISSSALIQRALHRYLASGMVQKHWKRVSRACRRRQMIMIASLEQHFPTKAKWSVAEGGFTTWVSLPQGISVRRLLAESSKQGVDFAPGEVFFIEPADQPFMRLGFAPVKEEQIGPGVKVLGQLLRQQMRGLR